MLSLFNSWAVWYVTSYPKAKVCSVSSGCSLFGCKSESNYLCYRFSSRQYFNSLLSNYHTFLHWLIALWFITLNCGHPESWWVYAAIAYLNPSLSHAATVAGGRWVSWLGKTIREVLSRLTTLQVVQPPASPNPGGNFHPKEIFQYLMTTAWQGSVRSMETQLASLTNAHVCTI